MPVQSPVNILYLEGDEVTRQRTSTILRQAGFRVSEAATTEDALRLVEESPDVVLLNEKPEHPASFELVRYIREHKAARAIPVVHFAVPRRQTNDHPDSVRNPSESHDLVASLQTAARSRRAEAERDIAVRQLQAVIGAVTDSVCILDNDGRILTCNPAFTRGLENPSANIVGLAAWDVTPPVFDESDLPAYRRVLDGGRELEATSRVGNRWFDVSVHPVRDESLHSHSAVCVLSEVTPRARLEEQLRRVQQAQVVGLLAGGLIHDFNNLLTAILGNVSLLLKDPVPPERTTEILKAVEKAARRAGTLVRQLLGSAPQDPLARDAVDLGKAVEETLAILRGMFDPRIEVRWANQPDTWSVRCDPDQLNQVVMNLCLNAHDAMAEGGTLTLAAENIVVVDPSVFRNRCARRGEFVRLRVSDTGAGIAPQDLQCIFEPFFTTKRPAEGTGLGLAVVNQIVRLHQGWIECSSVVGQGTDVDVYLPRATVSMKRSDVPTIDTFVDTSP
jgi:PAS domain S-box-containing protein